MVLEIESQLLFEVLNDSEELVEILKQVVSICRYCKPISPMLCVESCEIWKKKNEFLEIGRLVCVDEYIKKLLNVVKNDRRRKVMIALSGSSCSIKELQGYLNSKGYYHSQHTISGEYIKPLIQVGLVKKQGDKYRLTLYGQKFLDILNKFNVENTLPPRSRCYEEKLLKTLESGPKFYADLAKSVTQKGLSRSIKRLSENGLIIKSRSPDYIFYFKTKKVPKKTFSPTEKKIYDTVPEIGISAKDLSKKVGINLRRTYKYLRKLRKKRLVFTRKKPKTYQLSPSGIKFVNFLIETENLVSEVLEASAFLVKRTKQATDVSSPLLTELAPKQQNSPIKISNRLPQY
jgi:predicted transcriptional regulator